VPIPRDVADHYLDRISDAYHATVEAFLKADPEYMAEGLMLLSEAIASANHGLTEQMRESR
ncbi:uncharacterized protein METZ01_LOCUS158759, partial [marine metagenome]|tara:strand:- start:1030 stop:1212 length:183 start_codon:yes stop_codon:yes gene_type:complete